MNKKVLIFGASGFVGPYLVKEFSSHGYEVYGTDLLESNKPSGCNGFYSLDILDSERVDTIIKTVKPSYIVNLAAISSVGLSWKIPQKTMEINVCGTLNILESIKDLENKPKVLLIGSSEEYEVSNEQLTEESPLNANNPYGLSKMTQERFAQMYSGKYGIKVYRVRAFNHTGPGQSDKFVIPSWCKQAINIVRSGKPGTIKVGNLNVSRDFSDVRDVVRAYRMILESDYNNQVFNVGSGKTYLLKDILNVILNLCSPSKVDYYVDPSLCRNVDNPIIFGNIDKAKKILGWEPKYQLEETIKDIMNSMMR